MKVTKDKGAWVGPNVIFKGKAHIGFNSCVGYGDEESDLQTTIEDGVEIGAFCVIAKGATIGRNVEVDHYCRIGNASVVGENTKILYGSQVFDKVHIGKDCIIGGHVIDRTVIEDEVTYSGDMAHLHSDPTKNWDTTEEPSPVIRRGSVIGVGSLIIGGINIGPRAYIGAGEIAKCDIPEEGVLIGGKLKELKDFHGMIKVRGKK